MNIQKTLAAILIVSNSIWAGINQTSFEKWEKVPKCRFIHPFTNVEKYLSPDSIHISGNISNGLAEITLHQYFENPIDTALNLEYNFPMPQNASVHSFTYWSDDEEFNSKILETEEAQELFDSLSNEGEQAALLSQVKPNIFAQSIANIPIGGKIKVEVKLSYPLEYLDDSYSFTFPTLIGERYRSDEQEVPSSNLGWNPADSLVSGQVKVHINLISEIDFSNVSHDLGAFKTSDSTKLVTLPEGIIVPNKDIIFKIKSKTDNLGMNLSSYKKSTDSSGYFNFRFTPPDSLFEAHENKEVLFLLDHSGSQGGWPLEYQKKIAIDLINKLPNSSSIQVMAFSTSQSYAFSNPVLATEGNKEFAIRFIEGIIAGGGTDVYSALKNYLDRPSTSGLSRVLVFLTDGFITNEEYIFQYLTSQENIPSTITFGMGNSVNHYFLEEAATISNGYSVTVTKESSLEQIANNAFSKIISQKISLKSITWGSAKASQVYGVDAHSFFPGMRYSVFGQYEIPGEHEVCVTANSLIEEFKYCDTFNFTSADTTLSSTPKNWAKQKIKDLEIEASSNISKREEIIALSIEYEVLSNYTSFIAYNFENIQESVDQGWGGSAPIGIGATPVLSIPLPYHISFSIRSGEINLSNKNDDFDKIEIYDLQGNLIFESTHSTNQFTWNGIDSFNSIVQPGQYFIRFKSNNQWHTQAFNWK